jgi:hypothetical protein
VSVLTKGSGSTDLGSTHWIYGSMDLPDESTRLTGAVEQDSTGSLHYTVGKVKKPGSTRFTKRDLPKSKFTLRISTLTLLLN